MIMNVQSKHSRLITKNGIAALFCVGFLLAAFLPKFCLAQAGGLDPTFGDGGRVTTDFIGPNFDTGYSVVVAQADGKIVVAGYTYGDGVADFALVRYMPDGNLDASFGTAGRVTTDMGSRNDVLRSLIIQPDGKIVAGGTGQTGFALVRYNYDGSLDASFGNNGKVISIIGNYSSLYSIELQPDGKIVAVGYTSSNSFANDLALARYNMDGSLDASFGASGIVITDFSGDNDVGQDIAIQTDGKIVVVGSFGGADFALVRYNSNGSVDNSFGSNGKVTTSFGGLGAIAQGVVLQPDGKIVAAGFVMQSGLASRDFAVARYNGDGSLDTGFGTGGRVTTDNGNSNDQGCGVGLQSDGKIVVVGEQSLVARYNSNGSLDTGFGGDGLVQNNFGSINARTSSVAIQSDDKILIAGDIYTGLFATGTDFLLARYNNDGSLDTSLDGDGWVTTDFIGPNSDSATDVVISPSDGKIIAVGYTTPAWSSDFAVARYHPDGSLDASFGINGRVVTDIGHSNDSPARAVVQNDGKIVVAGGTYVNYPNYDFVVVRYNTDGSLDPGFGTGGKVITDFNAYDFASDIALQPDGKIVVGGQAATSGVFAVARYNSNGSLDASFGINGKVMITFGSAVNIANAIALQKDGKILIAGRTRLNNFTDGFGLARLNSNGTLDVSFDGDGKVVTDFGLNDQTVNALAIQPDGKIIAAGNASNYATGRNFIVARYNANGSLDATFDNDGWIMTDFGSQLEYANDVALQANGKIVVVGSTLFNYSYYVFALARYTNNGALDASFGTNGLITTAFDRESGASSVALQIDGKIVVAGGATPGASTSRDFGLLRFLSVSTPQEQIEAIMAQVQALIASGTVNNGQGNALLTKLQNALDQLASGKPNSTKVAINQLDAFISQVNDFISNGILTRAEGQPLIAAAQNAIALIQQGLGKPAAHHASDVAPSKYQLFQNYPNPFNPETEIRFQLPEANHVVVKIFNTLGAEIRTLVDAEYAAGYYGIRWDGKNNLGNPVTSGIYFCQIKAGTFSQVRQMSLVR